MGVNHFVQPHGSLDPIMLNKRVRFVCLKCNGEVPKGRIERRSNYDLDNRGLLAVLFCHSLGAAASPAKLSTVIPLSVFFDAPRTEEDWRFIVGFEGDWSCRLRQMPQEPFFFNDPPLGTFTQEELAHLFSRTPAKNVNGWGFRPEYYDIRHDPTGISFPAEFWFHA